MKATPIPDSIERRPGGIEKGQCTHEGGEIFRVIVLTDPESEVPLPWIHVGTGLSTCTDRSK